MSDDALKPTGGREMALTGEEQARATEIAAQMDLSDPNAVTQYGTGIQSRISEFADTVLSGVKSSDTGETGKLLTDLMLHVKMIQVDDAMGGGFFSKLPFVGAIKESARKFMARYQDVSTQIVKIVDQLEKARTRLLKDVDTLESFYERNHEYYRELGLFIVAGEIKLDELTGSVLPAMRADAESSGDPVKTQRYTDMVRLAGRLEKKLHDLRLSRMVALQAGPQIRLVQSNNQALAEKIQTSVLNTIPLWKNQMVLAITLLRQKQALDIEKDVSATTNELLERNAQLLKESSIDIAKDVERGVVDVETLKKVNAELITTIDDTIKIQRDGMIKREQARQELERLERELKEKLVEIKSGKER